MDTLLLYFALPLATIILAIVLQKLIKCPILVAGIFFAIYLIVTFAAFDINFLVLAIVYTLLAFITAVLTCFICKLIASLNENTDNNENEGCGCGCSRNSNAVNTTNAVNSSHNSYGCRCGYRRRF